MAEPIISCYPVFGHVFSIIGAHTQEHLAWVYNYFVQVQAPANFELGNELNYSVPEVLEDLPWLEVDHVDRDVILEMMDIIDFIKKFIDHGYYFYSMLNVSQIAAYQNRLYYHQIMIYGYDDEKQEMYFGDNFKDGKYGLGVATYEEIRNATYVYEPERNAIEFNCIKYKKEDVQRTFAFDRDLYVNLLSDYIEQRNNRKYWELSGISYPLFNGRKYGIAVYDFVQEYLTEGREKGRNIDKRGFYLIKEHKLILEKSLAYVLGENWKDKYADTWKLMEKDIQLSTIALNLCLKYNIVHDEKIIEKIRCYITELKENDLKLFPELIKIVGGSTWKETNMP